MLSESSKESLQLSSGLSVSKEHFSLERPGKTELKAEILFLNGMLYIWIGSASIPQMNNLQIAYPGQVRKLIILLNYFFNIYIEYE